MLLQPPDIPTVIRPCETAPRWEYDLCWDPPLLSAHLPLEADSLHPDVTYQTTKHMVELWKLLEDLH